MIEIAQNKGNPLPKHGAGKRRVGKPPSENFLLQKRIDDAYALQAAMGPTLSPILESPALRAVDDDARMETEHDEKPIEAVETESFPHLNETTQGNSTSMSST